jgi:hypothetical protein
MTDPTAPAPEPARPSFLRRHWGKTLVAALVLVPAAVFALWAAITLNYTYSTGERAGYVQKVSRKGWICKTWEGVLYTDIAKGFRSDSFSFTVRDDSLARVIEELSGKKVALRYDQHVGVPTSCFGETEYFVKGVRVLEDGAP